MITKAEILSVDTLGNTYKIRIPLFETAGMSSWSTANAIAVIPPGVFNGYGAGDIVLISFQTSMTEPVILGRLYQGQTQESKKAGGAIQADSLKVANTATLPANTKLTYVYPGITNAEKALSSVKSITDIINAVKKLDTRVTNLENRISTLENNKTEKINFSTAEVAVGKDTDGATIYKKTFTYKGRYMTDSSGTKSDNKLPYTDFDLKSLNAKKMWIDFSGTYRYERAQFGVKFYTINSGDPYITETITQDSETGKWVYNFMLWAGWTAYGTTAQVTLLYTKKK